MAALAASPPADGGAGPGAGTDPASGTQDAGAPALPVEAARSLSRARQQAKEKAAVAALARRVSPKNVSAAVSAALTELGVEVSAKATRRTVLGCWRSHVPLAPSPARRSPPQHVLGALATDPGRPDLHVEEMSLCSKKLEARRACARRAVPPAAAAPGRPHRARARE